MHRSRALVLAFSLAAPAACDGGSGPDGVDADDFHLGHVWEHHGR